MEIENVDFNGETGVATITKRESEEVNLTDLENQRLVNVDVLRQLNEEYPKRKAELEKSIADADTKLTAIYGVRDNATNTPNQ